MTINIFFALVAPDGELFQITAGDRWDPALERESDGWYLSDLLAEPPNPRGSAYDFRRIDGPLSASIAVRDSAEGYLYPRGLGRHPTVEGWRVFAVQAGSLFEAASMMALLPQVRR